MEAAKPWSKICTSDKIVLYDEGKNKEYLVSGKHDAIVCSDIDSYRLRFILRRWLSAASRKATYTCSAGGNSKSSPAASLLTPCDTLPCACLVDFFNRGPAAA